MKSGKCGEITVVKPNEKNTHLMGEHWIILVPESAEYIPSCIAQQEALQLFKRIAPDASTVEVITTPEIQFIDCGENLETISCPACSKSLDSNWWSDWMTEEYNAGYPFNRIKMPCCLTLVNIRELKYDWPVGFGRFRLEAMNACIGELSPEYIEQFECIFECKLHTIYRHI